MIHQFRVNLGSIRRCNVNVIKYSRWFTRNNAFRGYFVYPFMEHGRKLLQARALHHWIERASINRLILITQFSIFARKCAFSQSGSHTCIYIDSAGN